MQTPLQSPHYHYLEQGFSQWLFLLGYAEATIKSLPVHLRELFLYLERQHIHHIREVEPRHISGFIRHLKQRSNKTFGGGLSSSYINKSIHTLNTFGRYLRQTGKYSIDLSLRGLPGDIGAPTILSRSEILALYDSTFEPYAHDSTANGQRDRAIIAILYGCGLRRMEALALNIYDINLPKATLFVRKGKGNKQRHVPIARKHLEDLRAYLAEGRTWFMETHATGHYQYQRYGTPYPKKTNTDDEALFLNQWGKRMGDLSYRLKQMQQRAGIEQDFSPHDLRHSIATHLLQSGMDLHEIAKFLGHSSLVSTQVYTHILATQEAIKH